jgi:hypothetical protein
MKSISIALNSGLVAADRGQPPIGDIPPHVYHGLRDS